jgi:hypothetical protein
LIVNATSEAQIKPAGTVPTDSTLSLMNQVLYGGVVHRSQLLIYLMFLLSGANATFTVTTSGSSPIYKWQVNNGSGWVDLIK